MKFIKISLGVSILNIKKISKHDFFVPHLEYFLFDYYTCKSYTFMYNYITFDVFLIIEHIDIIVLFYK